MAGIAIRRLMRGEDGGIRVALVDLNTLQEVADPTGYTVIEPDNGTIEDVPYAQQPKSAVQVAEPGEIPEDADTVEKVKKYVGEGAGRTEDDRTGLRGMERDATNNFGYFDKPKGLGFASMLPGPLGLAGKAVNAGINANNMAAADKARSYLGLSPTSTFGKVKGVVSDNQGVVSKTANIGGTDYGITFGGVNPNGTTSLTPDEARTRSLTMDAPVKEGQVSERGQSYRTPSQTGNVQPSAKDQGTLGQNSYSQTGTRQGLAGKLGGIQASELGTDPSFAGPDDMSKMSNISAPVGIDAENEADMSGRMSRQWAGSLGNVPARSVKTDVVSATPSSRPQNINLAGTPSSPTVGDALRNSFTANPEANKATSPGAMSPAAFSAAGLGRQYTSDEKSAMARTLAGELNGKTLRGIVAGEPNALAEAAAALGTMDNRVNSVKNIDKPSPVASTLVGTQYNANMTSALPNGTVPSHITDRNYTKFGPALDSLVDSYTAGAIDSTVPDATHYVNKDVAKPAWGAKVTDQIGPHTFGTPDKSFAASAKGYGTAYGPVSARQVTDALGNVTTPTEAYSGLAPSPDKTASLASKVNSGFNSDLGGLMGKLGAPSSPASRMGATGSSFSPSSPGGMTGFGRTSPTGGPSGTSSLSGEAHGGLSSVGGGTGSRSTGPSKGTGSVADGSKGNESYGGGRVSSGATGGFADGRKGSESYGGGSTKSSSKSSSSSGMGKSLGGNPGAGAYGGSSAGSSKSSSAGSSKGSASSASSGNSRGGMSSGRGMGGFN